MSKEEDTTYGMLSSALKIIASATFLAWAILKTPIMEILQLFMIIVMIPLLMVGSVVTLITETLGLSSSFIKKDLNERVNEHLHEYIN